MRKTTFVCTLAAILLAGTVAAQTPAPDGNSAWAGALRSGLRPGLLKAGEPVPGWSLRERMAHYKVPGVAVAVLKGGEVVYAAGFGVREAGTRDAVDADTLFSVGSISKVVAAATTLRLVAQGRIDLDRDVDDYLKSWRIPAAPGIEHPKVTMRMLLSHTSGLGVHGFEDYLPGEPLPTLVQTLDGTPPAKNEPVRLQHQPGARSDYSGGGVMVEQKAIEDVSGMPLARLARAQVFEPVGMRRSTFENPVPAQLGNIAKAHDKDGKPTALPRGWQAFPEQAASGLWTSANELGAFVGALIKSYRGKGDLLPQSVAIQMMTEVAPGSRGLGPQLSGSGMARRFFHNGDNDSYHAAFEGFLETGDGFVILTNAKNSKGLRGEIRNALCDALGRDLRPPIRTIELDLKAPAYADYAGTYRIDAAVPMDLRGDLADTFEFDALAVETKDGTLTADLPGESKPSPLLPLTPARFYATRYGIELQFHRDAHGAVRAVSVESDGAQAYYRREAAERKPAAAGANEAARMPENKP
jgi:CubicO group peptidase (beta-lactamase class C family)